MVRGMEVEDVRVECAAVDDRDEHIARAQVVLDDLAVEFGTWNAFDHDGICETDQVASEGVQCLALNFQIRHDAVTHGLPVPEDRSITLFPEGQGGGRGIHAAYDTSREPARRRRIDGQGTRFRSHQADTETSHVLCRHSSAEEELTLYEVGRASVRKT